MSARINASLADDLSAIPEVAVTGGKRESITLYRTVANDSHLRRYQRSTEPTNFA